MFFQLIISGLAVGAIYGLVAVGFVVIFKSTGVFNFAQGDLVMLGAYLCFGVMTFGAGMSLPLAIIVTILLAAAFGWLLQQVLFRPMLGRDLLTMVMLTIALSMIIRGAVVMSFGPYEKSFPNTLPNLVLDILGTRISAVDLIIIAVSAVGITVLGAFFRFTRVGLQLRAIGNNPEASTVVGINANRMFTVAMMIGTITAAIGGILLASLQIVSPALAEIGMLAFPAAVVGGIRSVPGAVVGGVLIGVVGQLATGYMGGESANVIIYSVLLVMLFIRPQGILGAKEVVRA